MRLKSFLSIFTAAYFAISCSTESTPIYQLSTSVEPIESGTVSQSAPEADEGESITITANPNEHWLFDGWQGDLSGQENPASVVMDRDKNITARFALRDYPLTITIEGEGTVQQEVIQSKTTDYPFETVVQLTPIPSDGWKFAEWGRDVTSTNEVVTVTVDGDVNVTVTFDRIDYPLTITIEGEGEVEQEVVQLKTTEYPFETVVQLTSKPDDGWVFYQWSGDMEGNENPKTIEVNQGKEVTSVFKSIDELLSIEISGEGTVDIQQESFEDNPSRRIVTLTATPSQNWRFIEWTGDIQSENNPVMVTIDSNKEIQANFVKNVLTEISALSESNVDFHSVRYAGSDRIYASTSEILINDNEDGIWLSEDDGSTWSKTYDTGAVFITGATEDPDLVIAGLVDGGFVISQDGGNSWNSGRINDPFGNSMAFTDASAVNKQNSIYLSTRHATRSGIFRSNNLGNSWQHIFSNSDAINTFGSSIAQIEVVPSNPNKIYARTGFAHDIIKSTNGGSSFVSIKNGLPANITSIGMMRVNPDDGDQLFILNNISGNGGNSWSQQSISANNYFWHNGSLMQATSNSIRKSDDLGGSWQTVVSYGQELSGVSGTPTVEKASESIFLIYNGVPRYKISLDLLKD